MSLAKNTEEPINLFVMTMDLSAENPNFLAFTDEQISILEKVLKERTVKRNNRDAR
jgi:hypothetical protein